MYYAITVKKIKGSFIKKILERVSMNALSCAWRTFKPVGIEILANGRVGASLMFLSHHLLGVNFWKPNWLFTGTVRSYHLVPQTQALLITEDGVPIFKLFNRVPKLLYCNDKGSETRLSFLF